MDRFVLLFFKTEAGLRIGNFGGVVVFSLTTGGGAGFVTTGGGLSCFFLAQSVREAFDPEEFCRLEERLESVLLNIHFSEIHELQDALKLKELDIPEHEDRMLPQTDPLQQVPEV